MRRRPPHRDWSQLQLEALEERRLLAAVVGRHIFYDGSGFDDDPGIDPSDSAAIATDKEAYFTIEQLTDDGVFDGQPQVLGSNIVWQKSTGSSGEIYWYDGNTVTPLTSNAVLDEFPQISALGIAWERFIPGGPPFNREIIFHDTVTSEQSLTTTAVGNSTDTVLTLSDNRLAWEDQGDGDFDIHTWNDTGSPVKLSLNTVSDYEADADGNNIAWVEDSSPRNIRYFNGTSTVTIGTSTFAMHDPEVSGQNVVWEGFEHGGTFNREIYFYNGTTVQLLTNDSKNDFDPKISGNKIVWWSNAPGPINLIHYYDGSTITQISTGTMSQNPQIDGDNIVWQGKVGADFEIFFFDGTTVTQLTDNEIDDVNPQISGNHIVWQGNELSMGGTSEIYHAVFHEKARPENVTAYSKGINGIMVDIANPGGTLTVDDFTFRMSGQDLAVNNTPSTWVSAPAPTGFTVLSDTPATGTDRVEFIWADHAIENRHLQVIVEGDDARGGDNTNTGLSASDVFYFGNRIGDDFLGTPAFTFITSGADEIDARSNQGFMQPITNIYDYNKDGLVSAADQIDSRSNVGFMPTLRLGTVPLPPPPPAAAGDDTTGGDAGLAFALSAPAASSTPTVADIVRRAIDVPAQLADSDRGLVGGYYGFAGRRPTAFAELAADSLTDEAELPDDVLDALLTELREPEQRPE